MFSWIALGFVTVVALWGALTYNRFVRLRNESRQAWSGIELQLKRRADLVPNLAEVVAAYAGHERVTLEKVTAARTKLAAGGTPAELAAADGIMQEAMTGLLGLAEAYPQLEASDNFGLLARQLAETEDKIASARRYYNAVVRRHNTALQQLPGSLVAGPFGFTPAHFYRVEDDAQRQPVRVALDTVLAKGPPP